MAKSLIKHTYKAILNDLLYNCSEKTANTDEYITYGKGVLTATVISIMATNNLDCKEAIKAIKPYLPIDLNQECIPESWIKEF
jgi:hypothetical protein